MDIREVTPNHLNQRFAPPAPGTQEDSRVRYTVCSLIGMVLIVAMITATAGGLALVVNHLRKAPVGYEDAHGFHIVQQVKGSGILRYPKQKLVPAGSLKSARAHL
jgi:hypothetical protein